MEGVPREEVGPAKVGDYGAHAQARLASTASKLLRVFELPGSQENILPGNR